LKTNASPSKFAVKIESEDSQKRFAVLIDADNAQPSIIEGLLTEIAKFGVASVKRIYGDWTTPQLGGWKRSLLDYSIQPVQQFGYTSGKNSTDSALIIDAMDLLYTSRFDGFCLVSSDSDFTRLAMRLREEGLEVIGFGEQKTPKSFVAACDKFIYTEVLRPATEPMSLEPVQPRSTPPKKDLKPIIDLISNVVETSGGDDGWANLGTVGSTISKTKPDFDSRLYGFKKFSDLVRSVPEKFNLEERSSGEGNPKALYIQIVVEKSKPR
jgi:uncharacterized LabA/DUF88 family protein